MTLAIQDRDMKILAYVFTYRVASYSQIQRRFFNKADNSIARRRTRLLCDEGLLRPGYISIGSRTVKYVSITEKGWSFINEAWSQDMDTPHFKSESPHHDIRLAEVAGRFEKLSSFRNFKTENLLQSSSAIAENPMYRDLATLQADGALLLNGPEGRPYLYGIELEVNKKTIDRYNEKITSYYRAGGIDGVIYVCSNNEILDLVARADRNVRTGKDSIVYLGLESSVLESREKIYFKNVQSKGIGLF